MLLDSLGQYYRFHGISDCVHWTFSAKDHVSSRYAFKIVNLLFKLFVFLHDNEWISTANSSLNASLYSRICASLT